MHYIPEVKGVEQILDQEEEIAKNEFSKLEKKLQHERERESARGFSI
jgi:NFU1 iron-sulfur cluster scaffold homolog, mitochondrial